MSRIALFKKASPTEQPASGELELILNDISQYGRVRIGQYGNDNAWHCCVDVTVTPVGAKFEVKSEFNCVTASLAAEQCRSRLLNALRQLGAQL